MMTRTISVIAGTSITLGVGGVCPNIMCLEGYCNGAANTQYFLQLHVIAPASLVSGTTVPLRSWQLLGVDGYTFNKQDIGLQLANISVPVGQVATGYYIVLSSTDAVYTTSGITADINAEIEEFEIELLGTTRVTGNLAGGFLQIVADSVSDTNNLVTLQVTNTLAGGAYVQLFAKSPTVGMVPLVNLPVSDSGVDGLLAVNATATWKFGSLGKSIYSQGVNGTNHNGVFVGLSATQGTFDGTGTGSAVAYYK